MPKENHLTFKYLKKMAGDELFRVRNEAGLSVEEAAEAAGITYPNVVKKLEEGRSFHIFAYLRLVQIYGKRIAIRLE